MIILQLDAAAQLPCLDARRIDRQNRIHRAARRFDVTAEEIEPGAQQALLRRAAEALFGALQEDLRIAAAAGLQQLFGVHQAKIRVGRIEPHGLGVFLQRCQEIAVGGLEHAACIGGARRGAILGADLVGGEADGLRVGWRRPRRRATAGGEQHQRPGHTESQSNPHAHLPP